MIQRLIRLIWDFENLFKLTNLVIYLSFCSSLLVPQKPNNFRVACSKVHCTRSLILSQTLIDSIRSCCIGNNGEQIPFINPALAANGGIAIDDSVIVKTDIFDTKGVSAYADACNQFSEYTMKELSDAKFSIRSISTLSTYYSVTLSWNITFTAYSVRGLANMGKYLPGCKIVFQSLLDREAQRASFTWRALFSFIWHIILTGEFKIPQAIILGTTEFRFKLPVDYDTNTLNVVSDSPKGPCMLVSVVESINLVKSVNSGRLRNRRLALDLLEFLDARKPVSIGLNEWNDLIVRKVSFNAVSGMNQFDVDGLSEDNKSSILETANNFFSVLTIGIIGLGLSLGKVVCDKAFLYQQIHEAAASNMYSSY